MKTQTQNQTVNIDKEQMINQILTTAECAKNVKKNTDSKTWHAYKTGMMRMIRDLEACLPEHEQWMHPGCDKPISIADALEVLRETLKSP